MSAQSRAIRDWVVCWSGVFLINAMIPAIATVGDSWRYGVWAALWVLWACWLVAGVAFERLQVPLVVGGGPLALLQMVPCVHIAAAVVGFVVAKFFTEALCPVRWFFAPTVEGFIGTLTTGQLLIVAALLVGRWMNGPSTRLSEDGDEPPDSFPDF